MPKLGRYWPWKTVSSYLKTKYFPESCRATLLHRPYLLALCSIKQWGKPHKEKRRCLLGFGWFFYSEERGSLRIPEICLTDLDFADDIVLSDEVRQARQLLRNVEIDCGKVELLLNAKKTKAKYFNFEKEEMKTVDNTKIKQVVEEDTGEQDSNTWEAGYVLTKET